MEAVLCKHPGGVSAQGGQGGKAGDGEVNACHGGQPPSTNLLYMQHAHAFLYPLVNLVHGHKTPFQDHEGREEQ